MGQESPKPLNPHDVAKEILNLQDQTAKLGRNENEVLEFPKILKALQEGALSPEKALELARKIKGDKHEGGETAEHQP